MQLQLTCGLAQRVREIRVERFGKVGRPLLAEVLGLPERTWANYESGVSIPALVILRFVELTGVTPRWLRTGHGNKYSELYRFIRGKRAPGLRKADMLIPLGVA